MYRVSKYNQGYIYRTSNGQYVYVEGELQSEPYSSISDLVMVMQTNDQVSDSSERNITDNSASETKKKPRKKTARKTK